MSSGKKNKVYWYEFGTTCNTLIDFLDSSISIHIHEKAKLMVDSRSTLRRGTIRYAMERGSPGTTLWFLMDSLSAIRYALERRIPRTTLCGTWKLEHYVIHFVFLFMIGDHSLL